MGKRRAKGEGSLYKRENGLWVGQIYLPTGKKKVKYGKTQKLVRDWLHEQQEAIHTGTYIESKDLTLAVFLEQYMASQAASLCPKTVNSYQYLIKNYINPELGSCKLTQLSPHQLQAFYITKINSGLSKRTVQYLHMVLHKSLGQAAKWGMVVRNVADLVDPPSPTKKTPGILNWNRPISLWKKSAGTAGSSST